MTKKCKHETVVMMWHPETGAELSWRCSTVFGCGAQLSLGAAKGDRTRANSLLAPTKAAMLRARDEAPDAWPWDMTRPVAGQYEEQVTAAFRRHTAAAAAARHAEVDAAKLEAERAAEPDSEPENRERAQPPMPPSGSRIPDAVVCDDKPPHDKYAGKREHEARGWEPA